MSHICKYICACGMGRRDIGVGRRIEMVASLVNKSSGQDPSAPKDSTYLHTYRRTYIQILRRGKAKQSKAGKAKQGRMDNLGRQHAAGGEGNSFSPHLSSVEFWEIRRLKQQGKERKREKREKQRREGEGKRAFAGWRARARKR
ncbi:hypothetical protein TWF718_000979 [Orbilia javanica]|uniref:Uncharacterized protein n=1 Tax=Orbilia javanica TaxID=47235 RepID=A0AAN8RGG3_9PEZI